MTTENKAKLFGKMAQVMSKVRVLEKTGRNQFDKYDFVTADAIATRLGSAMAEVGLAFFSSIVEVKTEDYATKSGGNNFRTVVHMQITFACAETGATWTSDWFGEAIDRSDKSISKAAVSAVKYALLKTFLLAGGDEEDADAASPVVESRQQAPQPPATGNRATTTPDTPQGASVTPTEADGTPPHQRLFGIGLSVLGPAWNNGGRKWLLRAWSKKVTPDSVRESLSDFSDDEKTLLADYVTEHAKDLQRIWREYEDEKAAKAAA